MAISGSQKSLQFALGGQARGGAFRAGALPGKVFVSVGGVHRAYGQSGTNYRVIDLTIDDVLNEVPTTCRFTAVGFTPTVGMDVIITIGSKNSLTREFGGQILTVEQTYLAEKPANQAWHVSAIDYTWGLSKRQVAKKYTSTTIAVIAADLIASYASGYTLTVDPTFGLTGIDEFSATNEELPATLSRLVARGGGYWLCDYLKVVRMFTSDTSATAPTQLTAAHPTLRDLNVTRDLSQMVTRAFVEGGGATALADVVAGETIIPVADESWYSVVGGLIVSGPQRIAYTGRTSGGGGSFVGAGAFPSVPPVLTRVSGSQLGVGTYQYAYTDVTAAGESLPSPLASVVCGTGTINAPVTAPTITDSNPPGNAWGAGDHIDIAVTFLTAGGETTRGPAGTLTITAGSINVSNIPLGPTGTTARRLYRKQYVGASPTGNIYYTQISDNTSTTFSDLAYSVPETLYSNVGQFGPASNTASLVLQNVNVTAIAIGPSGVTQRKLYRTVVNGSQLKLLTTLADNTTTTYADSTIDGSLGANAPVTDTSALTQPAGQLNAGSTSLPTASPAAFSPTGGWVILAGGQVVRYTGISSNTLTGIPASGGGSITASVAYNSTVTAAPQLTGIPASGAGSVLYSIVNGDDVNVLAQVDDFAAQTTLAGYIGGDGIQETYVQDRRLSLTEATARGRALLAQRASVDTELRFVTRDLNAKSGQTQSVNVAAPMSVTGSFIIQQATLTAFPRSSDFARSPTTVGPTAYPTRTIHASSNRFTFEDLLRQSRKDTT